MESAEEARESKYRFMTQEPVRRLVAHMAVPTVVSMLVSAFYNMVDTLYVGHLSTSATAAVGLVFPLMALLQAIGFYFGQGSGNYISRALGKKDSDAASKMAATGFFSAFLLGACLTVFGLIFCDPVIRALGTTNTLMPDTRNYYRYILFGAPFLVSSMVLNNQLRLQGNAFFAMVGISVGAVLNIVLDPILIFSCGMGAGGAAAATSISQFVSFILLLGGCGKGGNIRIRFRGFIPSRDRYAEIFRGGFPSLCRQAFASIATVLLNQAAGAYGDSAIAAFSVVSRISFFAMAGMLGFGQGFQPVCGFNYSAGLYGRVKEAYWFCIKVATAIFAAFTLLCLLFAPHIITLFRASDPELIRIASVALRYQAVTWPLLGWIITSNMLMQNIGEAVGASILAFARQGLFFIPLILLLPFAFGLTGVELAQPLSDAFTFLLSLPLAIGVLRRINEKEKALSAGEGSEKP